MGKAQCRRGCFSEASSPSERHMSRVWCTLCVCVCGRWGRCSKSRKPVGSDGICCRGRHSMIHGAYTGCAVELVGFHDCVMSNFASTTFIYCLSLRAAGWLHMINNYTTVTVTTLKNGRRSLFASGLPGVTPEQQDFAALLASPPLGFRAPGSRSLLLFPHTILHTNSPFFVARWVDSGSKALQYNVGI